ncbi:PTS sugar transporter, partial [Clavibacter michiganensis subsp. insidiosus]
MRITGIGVGHGVATGPVIRMPDPLPEPGTEPFAGDAEAEVARVADALAATADDL